MIDLDDLYQEMVIDHSRRPRNFRKPAEANCTADGYNPLCGDRIALYVRLDGDLIADIGFNGSGCAISKASSSLMTECVKGKSKEEADRIFRAFLRMVTRAPGSSFDPDEVGDLEALSGVARFPTRVKCASLAWHTLRAALVGQSESATTE